jgi:hypothetical protein
MLPVFDTPTNLHKPKLFATSATNLSSRPKDNQAD